MAHFNSRLLTCGPLRCIAVAVTMKKNEIVLRTYRFPLSVRGRDNITLEGELNTLITTTAPEYRHTSNRFSLYISSLMKPPR